MSRELTYPFDFWSHGHLCMAVIHRHIKFGADIFSQSWVIDIFSKIKDGGRRHPGFVAGAMGPPTKANLWCILLVKILSCQLSSFKLIRVWIFCRSGLKVLFTPPQISYFGRFYPQNIGAHRLDPQRHILAWFHVFWAIAHKNPSTGLTCRRVWEKKV